jgi:hypothetical protein
MRSVGKTSFLKRDLSIKKREFDFKSDMPLAQAEEFLGRRRRLSRDNFN